MDQSRGETENPSLSRVKKKKSWTWLHFDEIENTKTCKCKYCPTTFVINGTGTMAKHMHSKHPAMIALASKHPSMIALDSKHPNMIDKPKQSPQNTKGKVTKSFKVTSISFVTVILVPLFKSILCLNFRVMLIIVLIKHSSSLL